MAYTWIKLYTEFLDDPKIGCLPTYLRLRVIELFLLAGKNGNGGALQPVEEMAWALRSSKDEVVKSLMSLAEIGVVQESQPGKWLVVNFAKRQSGMPDAERQKRFRAGEAKPQKNPRNKSQLNERPSQISHKLVTEEEVEEEVDKEAEADLNARASENRAAWLPAEPESPAAAPAAPNSAYETRKAQAEFNNNPIREAHALLCNAAGFPDVPANERARLETVSSLSAQYGKDRTSAALVQAKEAWCATPRKNGGGTYSPLNLGWVDWAMELLATGKPPWKNNAPPVKQDVDPFESLNKSLAARQAKGLSNG